MVLPVDTVFLVLFQFFLWAADCLVLCVHLESGASQSQLEPADDDACAGAGCVLGEIVSGAWVYDSIAGMGVDIVCGDGKDCGAVGDAACRDLFVDV